MGIPHEMRHKIFEEEALEKLEGYRDNIESRMRELQTLAKDMGGDTSQSEIYQGYAIVRVALQTIHNVCTGQHTYVFAAKDANSPKHRIGL